jgi:ADP-ribose pyrophosphatase
MTRRKKVFQALRFAVEDVYQKLDDGSEHHRQVVRHPGAVVILPLVDPDHVCLIYTYRVAIDRWILELPAGTLEPNEPPIETASRELIEETGYQAASIQHVHSFSMSPGILDERMHFYVASNLTQGDPHREVGEQIANRVYSWSDIDCLIRDGKIEDAKTLVALLWYMRYRTNA